MNISSSSIGAGKNRFGKKSFAIPRVFAICAVFAIVPFLLSPASLCAQLKLEKYTPLEPTQRDRQISRYIGFFLKSSHLSKKPTDETISERAFDLYFKSLDPMKVYFYQSDLDEFSHHRKNLGKMIAAGDVAFAFDVFNRYLQRIDERIDTVLDILDQPIDLEAEDEIVVDPELLQYPKTPEEARQRWVKRIKYDLLALKYDEINKAKEKREKAEKEAQETGNAPSEEIAADQVPDWDTLKKRLKRRFIFYSKRMHQTGNDDLLEMFLTSVTNSYDPHTSYMSPSSYENFIIQMRLNLDGIGATLQTVDGFTQVSKLVPGGAAAKAGELKAEDRIVAVGQNAGGPMVDIYEMKINDVVAKVRGPQGTKVRLEIVSPENADQYAAYKEEGKEKPPTKIVTIVREKIQLDDQAAKFQVFESGTKPDGRPFKVGVIVLPAFYLDIEGFSSGNPNYRSTTRDIQKILRQCVAENVDAVVLDLRYNGGGSLQEVVTTTGLFIDRGSVVMTKDLSTKVNYLDDRDPSAEWTGPLVVVINKYSASASEIFAGAIKDYRRGLIVGDSTTHGKGSVQDLKDIGRIIFSGMTNSSAYGALKLTVSVFYLPSGVSPQLDGVKSDVVIPSIVDHMEDISERDLDYPLELSKIPASPRYPTFPYVDERIIDTVRKQSARRVAENSDFQNVLKDIQTYLEYKAKNTQTLNETKFFAERDKLRAEREEIKKITEPEDHDDGEAIKRTYYLDEVMAITVDYIKALQESKITFPVERAIKSSGGALNFLFGKSVPTGIPTREWTGTTSGPSQNLKTNAAPAQTVYGL